MIKLEKIFKYYTSESGVVKALDNVNLEITENEFITITGESGSGKSTLLNVISGIDTYEGGIMYIDGEDTTYYSKEDWEEYRRNNVGFIFQNYNLVDSFSVRQNVEMALIIQGFSRKEYQKRALDIIKRVGLEKRIKTKASRLSGGEKQRLAIARVLAKDTKIIVADEPTGNLDQENSHAILAILHEISKEKLVVVVSHSFEEMKEFSTRHIRLFDGKIIEDVKTKETEKTGEVKILKEEKKVKRLKRGFLLATTNLFSQPKKAIFMFMTAFVTIFLIVLGYGAINAATRRSFLGSSTNYYDKAYYVGHKQTEKANNSLSSKDYEYLKTKGTVYNRKYGTVYNSKVFIYKDPNTDLSNAEDVSAVVSMILPFEEHDNKRQLYYGRKPAENDEAVISEAFFNELNNEQRKLIGEGKLLLTPVQYLRPDGKGGHAILGTNAPVTQELVKKRATVKVVGVVRNLSSDMMVNAIVFLKPEAYKEYYAFERFGSARLLANDKKVSMEYEGCVGPLQNQDILFKGAVFENIIFTNLLAKDEVSFSKDAYTLFKNSLGHLSYESTLEYTDKVTPVIKKTITKADGTKEEMMFANKVSVYETLRAQGKTISNKTIFLSESLYGEALEIFDSVNKVIFYPKNENKKVLEEILKDGFVYQSVKNGDNEFDNINKAGVFFLRFFIFLIVLGVYYISYLIYRIILRSKNTEYKIMKILGLPSSNVGFVIIFEMLWTFLISYACVVTMFLSLSFFKESEMYRAFGALFIWYDYLVLFVLCFIVFGFVILRYYRSLNKKKLLAGARGK